MISELVGQLKERMKEIFAVLRETGAAVIRWITSPSFVASHKKMVPVAANGNVLEKGKRFRKTSGHAPLFSFFAFITHLRITLGPVFEFYRGLVRLMTCRFTNDDSWHDNSHGSTRSGVYENEVRVPQRSKEFLLNKPPRCEKKTDSQKITRIPGDKPIRGEDGSGRNRSSRGGNRTGESTGRP